MMEKLQEARDSLCAHRNSLEVAIDDVAYLPEKAVTLVIDYCMWTPAMFYFVTRKNLRLEKRGHYFDVRRCRYTSTHITWDTGREVTSTTVAYPVTMFEVIKDREKSPLTCHSYDRLVKAASECYRDQ